MNETLNEAATLDAGAFAAGLANEHAADIVERLNAEPLETACAMLSAMPLERAVEVLDEPGLERGADLVETQTPERATALLSAISADRRAEIFRHLEAPARDRLLAGLDAETRNSLTKLLAYPENTAGSIMMNLSAFRRHGPSVKRCVISARSRARRRRSMQFTCSTRTQRGW